jgi:hypothetical protein
VPVSTRDTVDSATPESLATSFIVGRAMIFIRVAIEQPANTATAKRDWRAHRESSAPWLKQNWKPETGNRKPKERHRRRWKTQR